MSFNSKFLVSLNDSGIGDQIMSARVAAWIGEAAGLQFNGITSIEFDFESRSSISGKASGTEILKAIFLDKMVASRDETPVIFIIPYVTSIESILHEVGLRAKATPAGSVLALHVDGAEADYFYKNFVEPNALPILDTSFDCTWKRILTSIPSLSESNDQRRDKNILIHLRLGDIANLRIPGNQVVIPNHYIHCGPASGLHQATNKTFDRYDKSAEIFAFLRILKRKNYTISFHSDGFDYTRKFIQTHSKRFEELSSITHFERQIDEREEELLGHLNGLDCTIGETVNEVKKFAKDLRRSAFVISTSGHFAFNLTTGMARDNTLVLTEKFSRTSIKHPKIETRFWGVDFLRDLGEFVFDMQDKFNTNQLGKGAP